MTNYFPVPGLGPETPAARSFALPAAGVEVVAGVPDGRILRDFNPDDRRFTVDPSQLLETTAFSIAHQLVRFELGAAIGEFADVGPASPTGRQLIAAGLANYAAGALLMPYVRFREAAIGTRHDIDRLRQSFGTSFEQTCHRLSTLQRPGAAGLPFFFCRVDMAGNVTKRHSATRLQFARSGGACPLWVVHEAVATPDRVLVQLAETPDGVRYVSMAKGLVKPSGSYARPSRRYAVALGCEAEHAAAFIYATAFHWRARRRPSEPPAGSVRERTANCEPTRPPRATC